MAHGKRIIPTVSIYTNSLKVPVKIRPVDIRAFPPRSVPLMFDEVCRQYPLRSALNYKKNGHWHRISYGEYQGMVRRCAKGFLNLGLLPNTAVCIIGFNSPEWFISNLGAIYAGGVAAGIYTTNSSEACLHCLNNSNAKILVMESAQSEKILRIRNRAKSIKAIIQYGGETVDPSVLTWEKFMQIGETIPDSLLENAKMGIRINQCCTLVFTSGTTGSPKGVMLSHDNIVYDALKIGQKLALDANTSEVYVSYLPLSHIAGNVVDIHCTFLHAVKVFFAEKDALRGSIINTFQEVKPTRILSVPRVWEKIYETLQEKSEHVEGLKKTVLDWAKKQGLSKNLALERNEPYSSMYHLANYILFKKIKKLLGVERVKTIVCGAAPLATEIKLYFASLDILIMEGFGMSESSALHCCCVPENFRFDSCGTPCDGMITFIENPDENGNGELCIYGRHVFMGYLDDEANTRETIDERGYLHSGDIARMDEDGFVYITGRLKELIITAGGENIAPVLIEHNIKMALPFIGYAVVIGDRRKFLIVLLTLAAEVNENQEPMDTLSDIVQTWLAKLGLRYKTMKEVMTSGPHKKIIDSIQMGLDEANENAISNAQKVHKFALLPQDFSVATGELGPTMKVKRKVVADKYQNLIDRIYEQTNAGDD